MKSIKILILTGGILGILLSLLVYTEFMDLPSVTDVSYYSKADFDYVIPQPGNEQRGVLESLQFVDKIIPYYIYSGFLNNRSINIYLMDYADISNTPFGGNYLIEGKDKIESRTIVLDEKTKEFSGLKLGDSIEIDLEGIPLVFEVVGISEKNNFSNNPSVVVLYDGLQKEVISSSFPHLSYSGAFVVVNDRTEAESYFANDYIPEGKIGDASWYASVDIYEYVRKSISSSPTIYEITDVGGLKTNEMNSALETSHIINQRVQITVVVMSLTYVIAILFVYLFSKNIISDDIRKGLGLKRLLKIVYLSELLALLFPLACGFIILARIEIKYAYELSIIILFCYVLTVYIEHLLIKKIGRNRNEETTFQSIEVPLKDKNIENEKK